ncbi:MAG TPA: sulfide-dependent adenosine diphosphate thiazole synthase [Methanocella sp.]|uniref:sulfide-dependent adenosine diphosphate thiazole synthase n=1 Tax=Methanocella sp. TaxID=2052833 RepID=UPI002B60E50C|nr:sulfide-dependent adenosine diphosphate thiazole synthase [Methanocella sp.]HTY91097.1 sulfide-dependent adenosine diphosphate thiazole synthase [Methanocella sp.]
MGLDEVTISKAIIEDFYRAFLEYTDIDAGIVGAGPSGLVCAAYLAQAGFRIAVFERKLSVGGGMWGGGMMFPRIVVQESALDILDDFGIRYKAYAPGYYLANSVEAVAKLAAGAVSSGAEIFNLMSVEDVMIREDDAVAGLVVNWTAVEMAGLHVDPLSIKAKMVVDATGHDASVCRIVERKVAGAGFNEGKGVVGEKSMWAEAGEKMLAATTREVYPGLVVTGMAANAVSGGHRMGPVFGGMLISGTMAAELVKHKLKERQ